MALGKGCSVFMIRWWRVASEVSLLLWQVFLLAVSALHRGTLLLAGRWRGHLGKAGLRNLGRGLAGDFALLPLLLRHRSYLKRICKKEEFCCYWHFLNEITTALPSTLRGNLPIRCLTHLPHHRTLHLQQLLSKDCRSFFP